MLAAQFSISALNDCADTEDDRRTGRRRPVALGMVAPATALAVTAVMGAFALLGTLFAFGSRAAGVMILCLACGFAYDLGMKRTPFSFLPFAAAFPLLLVWSGAVAANDPSLAVVFLAGAPLAVAIHLADTLPDRIEDSEAGLRTLAVTLGHSLGGLLTSILLLVGGSILAVTASRRHESLAALALIMSVIASTALLTIYGRRPTATSKARWIPPATAAAVTLIWLVSLR
jgi:4-hydroxybenzoate polyprenyltransferase